MNDQEIFLLISNYLQEKLLRIAAEIRGYWENNLSNQFQLGNQIRNTILDGSIRDAIELLESSSVEQNRKRRAEFILHEQLIAEAVMRGNRFEALNLLRTDVRDLDVFKDRYHALADVILKMESSPVSKSDLLCLINEELKEDAAGIVQDENRLMELLNQAQQFQMLQCPNHYGTLKLDLFNNHCCPPASHEISEKELIHDTGSAGINHIFLHSTEPEVFVIKAPDQIVQVVEGNVQYLGQGIPFWPTLIADKIPLIDENWLLFHHLNQQSSSDSFELNCKGILSFAFLSDFNQAVFSTEEQITYLIDFENGKIVHSWIRLRCNFLLSVKEKDYFLAIKDDGSIAQIKSTDGYELLREFPAVAGVGRVTSAYVDDCGRLLMGFDGNALYLYEDFENYSFPTRLFMREPSSPNCSRIRSAAIISGNLVIAGSLEGKVFVWNCNSGRLLLESKIHDGGINAIIPMKSDGFMSCGDDGKVYKWKLPFANKT